MTLVPHAFGTDSGGFLLEGRPFQILAGEMHYPRVPRPYWRHRLRLARALGLNTICTYLFWNGHEPRPGQFDFDDNLDVAAFVRMAQEEGLWVIVRPGPYVCAEWDFGGLPAWLLETADVRLRCSDARYLGAVRRYVDRVGQELSPLLCERGGPILMVQLENEYGSYGNDKPYLRTLRDMLRAAGFTGTLFTSDGPDAPWLRAGTLPEVLAVANFGSKPAEQLGKLRAFRPGGPVMCGEFWAGWFDHWGRPREGGDAADGVQHAAEIGWMLGQGASFNLYMFHGGTNFGFTAGANFHEAYRPTVTSYDYWAAVDEAGRPTAKYHAIRTVLAKYQPGGAPLPEVPANRPMTGIPRFELTESASLWDALPEPVVVPQPRCMESFGQAHGLILYRTSIAGLQGGDLRVTAVADYAQVYLNGRRVGTLDRRLRQDTVRLDEVPVDHATLDVLVDAMGHVNFGSHLVDRKGITERVELAHLTLMDWLAYPMPLDAADVAALRFARRDGLRGPSFHRGTVHVDHPADTFLDLRGWGKGYVWVNGHNLGRYWQVGPQQTLFLPGVWLRAGANEVVVLDLEFAGHRTIAGVVEPVLDQCPAPPVRQAGV